MLSIHFLTTFVQHHDILAYVLLFFGVILEGEFVLLLSGILANLGALSFPILYVVGFLGALMKTYLGYTIGGFLKFKYPKSKFFRFITRRVNGYLPQFKKDAFWSIFISKFIYGINHFVLIYSGYTKVPKKTFYKAEIGTSFLWVLEFLTIGYIFSFAALTISHDIRKFTFILLAFVIGFIILQKIINFFLEVYEARKAEYEEEQE